MARPARNDIATKDMHRHLQRALRKRRAATAKDIELWAYAQMGLRVSDVTIGKILNGTADPEACTLEGLIAVSHFYGLGPADLGEAVERRLAGVASYFNGPDAGFGGLAQSSNGGNPLIAGGAERHLSLVPEVDDADEAVGY